MDMAAIAFLLGIFFGMVLAYQLAQWAVSHRDHRVRRTIREMTPEQRDELAREAREHLERDALSNL